MSHSLINDTKDVLPAPRPAQSLQMSAASIARMKRKRTSTLIMDEAPTLSSGNSTKISSLPPPQAASQVPPSRRQMRRVTASLENLRGAIAIAGLATMPTTSNASFHREDFHQDCSHLANPREASKRQARPPFPKCLLNAESTIMTPTNMQQNSSTLFLDQPTAPKRRRRVLKSSLFSFASSSSVPSLPLASVPPLPLTVTD
uniref:Uncharacterized protein n=1 Tax=Odontella aurita TaxID=265563 RepID=A0A7S4N0Z8_9STRA|mmetsp:Transcript_43462/g.132235  ORF Transcript_43462/g.132235 Transcript_43462/m.132235 type:complete len:202 (+) Transcript_43462:108-713(+)